MDGSAVLRPSRVMEENRERNALWQMMTRKSSSRCSNLFIRVVGNGFQVSIPRYHQ